jgi:hypothetical protein
VIRGQSCCAEKGAPAPETISDVEEFASNFLDRLSATAEHEMHLRYELGHYLHGVRYMSPGTLPPDVIERIARVLGWHPSALRRCARVTEMISAEEFSRITSLRGCRGWRVTWSHVELLSEVRSRSARWALAQSVIQEKLSVRALAACIRAERSRDVVREPERALSNRVPCVDPSLLCHDASA